MACTGHSNVPNGVACTGFVAPVPPASWTNAVVTPGEQVSNLEMSQLRTAIIQELARRGTSYVTPVVVAGDIINSSHFREMRNAINACKSWTFPAAVDNTSFATSELIESTGIETLRSQINIYKQECICNCNYACTCNCNYCTCNCNYCTCDCNYCTCDCNYLCTCNCNYYSDIRLKKDIEYL
jgi:hypothetical protein